MKSNWDSIKPRSNYHFDPFQFDPAYDSMKYLGRFDGDWSQELEETIQSSKAITWRNRNPQQGTSKEIDAEEYDLTKSGADADLVLTNLEYNLLPVFQKMMNALHLKTEKTQSRVHVQLA
jgi:hypothetical protein